MHSGAAIYYLRSKGVDSIWGCPGVCPGDSISCNIPPTLPPELNGYITMEQISNFCVALDKIFVETHVPMMPCACVPCYACHASDQHRRRKREIDDLLPRVNTMDRCYWQVVTYGPFLARLIKKPDPNNVGGAPASQLQHLIPVANAGPAAYPTTSVVPIAVEMLRDSNGELINQPI